MSDEKLKPCPFCGDLFVHAEPVNTGGTVWGVHCPNGMCPTAGNFIVKDFSEAEVITSWNTRSEGPADLKAVREGLAELERSFGHWSPPTPHQRASLNRLRASLQRKETVDE